MYMVNLRATAEQISKKVNKIINEIKILPYKIFT